MIVTVRAIKSFEYRTFKNIVLEVEPDMPLNELFTRAVQKLPKAFQINYNTLKIYVNAHGSKTNNLIINLENDDFLDLGRSLGSYSIENETEISMFNDELYFAFKQNPTVRW
jgi:hypothetical protein